MDNNKSKHRKINIDLFVLGKMLWDDKKRVCKYCFIAAIAGVIIAFSIPKEYKSTVVLAPEETENGFMGSISSLASMVGMDMRIGNTGDAIYPEIYPDVMGSTDFLVALFSVPVTTADKSYSADYATYLMKKTKFPWWEYPKVLLTGIIKKLQGNNTPYSSKHKVCPFRLTRTEYELMLAIEGNLKCAVDKKTNVISITISDQDPYIAACMADTVTVRLQKLITDYRTKKSREDLEYLKKIHGESQVQYKKAQDAYAAFTEGHRGTVLESFNQIQEKLNNEMDMALDIYTKVSAQLELAKAKVQERTPAFTTIQSASVPVKHSNTPKIVILGIFIFLAVIARCCILFAKNIKLFLKEESPSSLS